MNPELAVMYAKLDIYEQALKAIVDLLDKGQPSPHRQRAALAVARFNLKAATILSQPASQPEKPMRTCTKDKPDEDAVYHTFYGGPDGECMHCGKSVLG